MDPIQDLQLSVIHDSQRLLKLTSDLNLDDYDKLSILYSALYPVVVDFIRLQGHVEMQQRVCFRYGLDNTFFDQTTYRSMKRIVCHLATVPEAFEAYCFLKSQLFLEQNDFLDDIIQKVEEESATCTSQRKKERLMLNALLIRNIYEAVV